jgi:hypothetical protein
VSNLGEERRPSPAASKPPVLTPKPTAEIVKRLSFNRTEAEATRPLADRIKPQLQNKYVCCFNRTEAEASRPLADRIKPPLQNKYVCCSNMTEAEATRPLADRIKPPLQNKYVTFTTVKGKCHEINNQNQISTYFVYMRRWFLFFCIFIVKKHSCLLL